jgi:para-nitrobenzyl esterase
MSVKRLTAGAIALVCAITLSSSVLSQPQAGAEAQAQAAAAEAARLADLPRRTVRVETGQLRGYVDDGVATFMGVPYAKPPVGDLRWRSPRPADNWPGVRDALEAGNSCAREEEDCLYLNIQAPADAQGGDHLPVMVWIHGGSFTSGAGANYDGTRFTRQDIVVVTVNYRMGRSGWFAHPALTAEDEGANFGNQDQIASLQWVQDNIAAFGGDPDNVTIFGESAGAISIMYLTTSPQAQGLFHKAIVQSGFPRNQPTPLSDAEGYGVRVAEANGINGAGPDAAAALRRLDLSTFPGSEGYFDNTRPYPIIDGKTIFKSMTEGYEQGDQAKVPLMIGGTSNDASLYRRTEEHLAEVPGLDAMMRVYNPTGAKSEVQVINDYWTAMRMTEPNRNIARVHAETGQPTYLYYFSFVSPDQRENSLGARHAAEISYVFGTLRGDPSAEDIATAQAMNAYWAAFAKYGDPGAAGGPAWPAYTGENEMVMEFGNDGVHTSPNLLQAQLDYMENAPGRLF